MATVNLGAIKFNWKGAFNNSTAYAVDDVVSSSGNSYVCILASTGNAVSNGTYWNLMAQAGTNGTNGTDLTSTLTTRGDLVFRNASTLARLPKGTSGYFLKQGANDPEWGAVDLTALSAASLTSGTIPNARYGTPTFNGSNLTNLPGGGKILQVLSGNHEARTTTTSTSFVDLSGSNYTTLTITPSATSSKIFIMAHFSEMYVNNAAAATSPYMQVYREISGGSSTSVHEAHTLYFTGVGSEKMVSQDLSRVDNPNTTSGDYI